MAPQLVIEQRFPQEVSVFKDDVLSLLQSLHPMQLPIRVWHWGPFDPKFCEELFCPPHLKIFFLSFSFLFLFSFFIFKEK